MALRPAVAVLAVLRACDVGQPLLELSGRHGQSMYDQAFLRSVCHLSLC